MTVSLSLDDQLLETVSSRLNLRDPNRDALETLARAAELYGDGEETYEGVLSLATGVGKTYVMAATIDYFTAQGTRGFAIITPGRTILRKTVENFSPGTRRSLLGGMDTHPVLVTADNFADGATRAAMEAPTRTKLYVFTVQALLGSAGDTVRKTRSYQETLGGAFYDWLQDADDLIVLADEHHVYEGPKFSKAVRDLRPRLLFGFTATPSKTSNILFQYPLSRAIADKLVKIPVVVGRKDDRTDPKTKLSDGVLLLEWKEQLIARYRERNKSAPRINPVMLVVAENIEEAKHYEDICVAPDFFDGRYAGKTLVVTSKSDDEALAMLDGVDDPASPVRILINVQKLKEGWDNAQVYVLAAMRASVSDVLKEQTLGRGLRLPFGEYTDVEGLNTLEVLSHERYEELLRKANLLKEQLIDYRAKLEADAHVQREEVTLAVSVEANGQPYASDVPATTIEAVATDGDGDAGGLLVTSIDARKADAEKSLIPPKMLAPRQDVVLRVPRLRQTSIESPFDLADIQPLTPFKVAGEHLAVAPEEELRRQAIRGRVNEESGYVQLMADDLQEELTFSAPGAVAPLAQSRQALEDLVMCSEIVPAHEHEREALRPILDAFIAGLGVHAERVLSANLRRAQEAITDIIEKNVADAKSHPRVEEVVDWTTFDNAIDGKHDCSEDRREAFVKLRAYEGWKRALYAQAWFDSSPERTLALTFDNDDEILVWLRLQRGYLTILWGGMESWYNPDFVAVEDNGTHWIVEVKMDKEMEAVDVQEKKQRATIWASHATAKTRTPWRYLLLSQSQVEGAKESWPSLRQLAEV